MDCMFYALLLQLRVIVCFSTERSSANILHKSPFVFQGRTKEREREREGEKERKRENEKERE